MYTATLIRRHMNRLKDDESFSIRDFINYGSRNAVDQIFHRLNQPSIGLITAIITFFILTPEKL